MLAGWYEANSSEPGKQIQLSDGSTHDSWAEAQEYIDINYPDGEHADTISNTHVDKLLLSGTAATIGLAGIFFVVKRRLNKDQ